MSTIAPALLLAVNNDCGGEQKNASVNFPAPLSLQRKTCLRLPSALTRDTSDAGSLFFFFFPRTLQTFSFPSSSFFTDTRGKLTKGNKTRENVCYAVHTGQFLSCVLHYQSGVRHAFSSFLFFFWPSALVFFVVCVFCEACGPATLLFPPRNQLLLRTSKRHISGRQPTRHCAFWRK
ncbi:hypothetical protein TcG_02969 [Trypanosoma cruzi]|nr:hypothetical protein TcG_02969 [Trypanosoma cruzi]